MRAGLRAVAESVPRAYASVVFLADVPSGLVLLAATFLRPDLGAAGLAACVAGSAFALAAGLPPSLVRAGAYGTSPLLTGIALAWALGLTPATALLILLAAVLAVLVTAVLGHLLWTHLGIGPFALPFLLVTTALLWPMPAGHLGTPVSLLPLDLPPFVDMYLRSLGSIFFLVDPLAGLVLLAVLVRRSRILAALTLGGFALGLVTFRALGGADAVVARDLVGLNFALTAVGIGGALLVPGGAALVHALLATAATAAAAFAALRILGPQGLPVFSWPFHLVVPLWTAALRLRSADAAPALAALDGRSPEDRLVESHLRARRFGRPETPRWRLPFLGAWTVTQGVEGHATHRGPWAHAWDFEVTDAEGFPFRAGGGGAVADFLSWRLPVVAPADGTVVDVRSHVPDNPPGEANTAENWGNTVVLQHGPGRYSLVAHLARDSIRVRPGEFVREGRAIALSGASGRAPRPHLHFQAQAAAHAGAPAIPAEFDAAVVEEEGGLFLRHRCVPRVGERLRRLETLPGARAVQALREGTSLSFFVEDGGAVAEETWEIERDLLGHLRIRARPTGAEAAFLPEGVAPAFVEYRGDRRTALFAFALGASRTPWLLAPGLRWRDEVDPSLLAPAPLAPLLRAEAEVRVETRARGLRTVAAFRIAGPFGRPRPWGEIRIDWADEAGPAQILLARPSRALRARRRDLPYREE